MQNRSPFVVVFGDDVTLQPARPFSLYGDAVQHLKTIDKNYDPQVYKLLPRPLPRKLFILPSAAHVASLNITRDEAARRFYPGVTVDTALPHEWVRGMRQDKDFDPVPHVVWGYPDAWKVFGIPLPLTAEAMEAMDPDVQEELHKLFGSERGKGQRLLLLSFRDAFHREMEVEVRYGYVPADPGYSGSLSEDARPAEPPKVFLESVKVFPEGPEILHLLNPSATDELEGKIMAYEMERDDG